MKINFDTFKRESISIFFANFRIVSLTLPILFLSLGLELPAKTVDHYQKYDEQSCRTWQLKPLANTSKEFSTDQHFIPNVLDQGTFGTCYGFSATYLLQYLINKTSGKVRNLNEIEVLGQGCNNRLRPWGWQTDSVLHNFRIENQGYFTDAPSHVNYTDLLSHMNELSKLYCDKKSTECCKLFIDKILTKDALNLINRDFSQIEKAVEKEMSDQNTEKDTFSYRLVDKLNPNNKTQSPKYNVFFVKFKSASEAQAEIKKLFQGKDRFPINLNICAESEGNKCKDVFHAVTVSGVKEVCCQNKCHDEWNIVNSYGSDSAKQGWHLAAPLAESLINFNKNISYIRPCSENPTTSETKCKPYIQGTDPLFRMARTGDVRGMKALLEAMPELRKRLTSFDSRGKSPIYDAIYSGKEDMVKFILQQPGFDLVHHHGAWPVFRAAQTGELKILRLLLDHKAPFHGPVTDERETAMHAAAESGNPDVIQLLIDRKLPINARDKKGNTPLALAIGKATSNRPEDLYYRKLHTESVRTLLNGGADLSIQAVGNQSLKKIIENSNNTELKKLLDQNIILKDTSD